MKLRSLFILFLISLPAFSQLEDTELDSLKIIWRSELQLQADELGIGVMDETYGTPAFRDTIYAMFQKDTFVVEGIYAQQLYRDQTTFGMNRASMDCEKEYDALLNKYYNLYLKKLKPEDKKVLITSQKAWLKFRDSEREVNEMMIKTEYSGGGTIQQLIYASQYLYITRQRVFELVSYMSRME